MSPNLFSFLPLEIQLVCELFGVLMMDADESSTHELPALHDASRGTPFASSISSQDHRPQLASALLFSKNLTFYAEVVFKRTINS